MEARVLIVIDAAGGGREDHYITGAPTGNGGSGMVPGLMQLLLPAASPSAPRQRLRWLASPDRAASSASLDNRATHVRNSRSVSALTRERARESRPPAERATPSLN